MGAARKKSRKKSEDDDGAGEGERGERGILYFESLVNEQRQIGTHSGESARGQKRRRTGTR